MTKTSLETICGFLVVRLPNMNRDLDNSDPNFYRLPVLGDIYYSGIDRSRWYDIDTDYYNKTLPEQIKKLYEPINKGTDDLTGIDVCKDFQVAVELLNYSNRDRKVNELISFRSEKLKEIKGAIEFDASKIVWLGYDMMKLGEWSLLTDGLFLKPEYFQGWEKRLNKNGLFDDPSLLDDFVATYQALAEKEIVEPLSDDERHSFDAIEIGRVLV